MSKKTKNEKPSWKDTIILPKTSFSMRANLAKREPETVKRWNEERLYHKMLAQRADAPVFTLHDGPPYANGNIHHGHALNKVLKDIVVKQRHMAGFKATNIPGWDCHGLPIELQVDKRLGKKKREMSIGEFRKACRSYANEFVEIQREEFKRLMILAEWERPYRTMDFSYEATTIRELGKFFKAGYVYKGLKPVHWSWAAVTALAEAEVEYASYNAPSVYVKFEVPNPPEWLLKAANGRVVNVVIWTTTPWTLPSNLAIALNSGLRYEVLALSETEAIVVAAGRKKETFEACRLGSMKVLHSFEGHELVGYGPADCPRYEARHPFIDRGSLLVPADYVTLEQGTGCVHTAPGHGAEDYVTGKKYGLEVLAPVNKYGKFDNRVPDYEGMHVFKANPLIARRLEETGRLLNRAGDIYVVDRYPHCWRTKKPLIFRATEQWFVAVDHDEMREKALSEVKKAEWIPHWGENRIAGMLETRPDWCISRQRTWGVPITAFTCSECHNEIIDHKIANHVADLAESAGSDVWFEATNEELVPEGYRCPHCSAESNKFEKVVDILDVWFDSGVSWAAVLRDREKLSSVADLYLEGSDQHRGWFHTSLLVGIGSMGKSPYKAVLTHGFVVDSKGHKYSKSSPKYKPLSNMLQVNGAEVLRLWVAAVDYRNDMVLTPQLLKQVGGSYRKIRNTLRFLLGNLSQFDPATDRLAESQLENLGILNKWMLSKIAEYIDVVREAYLKYEFHTVYHATLEFCNQTLSNVYLDVLKDRLYCEEKTHSASRASRAIMYEALRTLTLWIAPILSFTADEIWGLMPHLKADPVFVFLADLNNADEKWRSLETEKEFETLLALRGRVNEEIDARRPKKKGVQVKGQLGSSQEAVVTLLVQEGHLKHWKTQASMLKELFIVSEVIVKQGDPAHETGIELMIEVATTEKCPRCWNRSASIGNSLAFPTLCTRCASILERS